VTLLILFIAYLCLLIPIAWIGKKRAVDKTPHDFYLAGGGLGFAVLLCTLFATQYSGNTFMAFPGKAYREGYWQLVSIPFMMAIILGYMTFAIPLRRIAGEKGFVTPCDWIHHRYANLPLTLICAVLMSWALLNYLLAQLMAIGHAYSVVTGDRLVLPGLTSYQTGVLLLAFVIVLYETIGGMRAVAWTDTVQGGLMFVAILGLSFYLLSGDVQLSTLPQRVMDIDPGKVLPPSPEKCRTWVGMLVLFFFGGAMYPQGIQRLYAAKSMQTLKRSLAVLVFLPLGLVLFTLMMGVLAIPQFPALDGIQSDKVMTLMLNEIATKGAFFEITVSILLLGALAAIMSTADSVLLSLSSIFVKDFYAKTARVPKSDEQLLTMGKIFSWVVAAVVVAIALSPRVTLFRLLEIKFEFLIQVAPPFILGFYCRGLKASHALVAVTAGTIIALIGFFQGVKWWGIHPGVIGCLVNLAICASLGCRGRANADD
jgi:SSS family solute:Na+ symporter/sodium/pantothenate symporter